MFSYVYVYVYSSRLVSRQAGHVSCRAHSILGPYAAQRRWCMAPEKVSHSVTSKEVDENVLYCLISSLFLSSRCDYHITIHHMSARPLSNCLNINIAFKKNILKNDSMSSEAERMGTRTKSSRNNKNVRETLQEMDDSSSTTILSRNTTGDALFNLAADLPLISIMAATTTRKIVDPSTSNLALFLYLLPSLVRSLDCGYRYEYVLGFDAGDPFYDSKAVCMRE